jgi:hypothetical protein
MVVVVCTKIKCKLIKVLSIRAERKEGRKRRGNMSSLLKQTFFIIHHFPLLKLIKYEYMNSREKLRSIIDDNGSNAIHTHTHTHELVTQKEAVMRGVVLVLRLKE